MSQDTVVGEGVDEAEHNLSYHEDAEPIGPPRYRNALQLPPAGRAADGGPAARACGAGGELLGGGGARTPAVGRAAVARRGATDAGAAGAAAGAAQHQTMLARLLAEEAEVGIDTGGCLGIALLRVALHLAHLY